MTSMLINPELERLGVQKQLGCGHEGCVYTTDHDTVIKVAHGYNWRETSIAARLKPLFGKHKIVPHIYRIGEVHETLSGMHTYVEREPLNDLPLGEEAKEQFLQGYLGKLLSAAYGAQKVFGFPKTIPVEERKLLSQIAMGYSWLGAHGIDLQDHNTPDNWGIRADGSVAVRDLGHVVIVDETFDEHFPRKS
jgi:hypothetical protein